jgi:hypothetical protein
MAPIAVKDVRRLAGLAVVLSGRPALVRELVGALFVACPEGADSGAVPLWCLDADERSAPDIVPRWLLDARGASASVPELIRGPHGEAATFERMADGYCAAWLDAERREIRFVAARLQRPAALASGSRDAPAAGIAEASVPVLAPIFRELLLDRGRVLLHSGCVARRDGAGWLFIADGGGGKTTAVLSLLRRGCRLLGDDLNAVRAEEGLVEAFGWPEPLNVSERTALFFPEVARAVGGGADWGRFRKLPVLPQLIYGADCVAERCRLEAVYVVKVASEGPSVRRLTTFEALDHLFAAHRFGRRHGIGKTAFAHLTALVSLVPAFELSTGPCAADLGRWFLDRCAAESGA